MLSTRAVLLIVICASVILGVSGCASTRSPSGYLVKDTETQWEVYGAWITLEINGAGAIDTVKGEFISYQDSNVCVLTEKKAIMVQCTDIRGAILEVHSNRTDELGAWTFLGILSTATHGWGFFLSVPAWLIVGTSSTSAESWADHYEQSNPPTSWWLEMKKFSRFPQGIPKTVSMDRLRFNRRRLMK